MKPTLNASLLIRNLRDTEDQSAQSARLPACLADAGDGVSYLFINLLSPLMDGREVHSTQLDMQRFTLRDIQALYDLCGDEPNALFPAPKMLRKFYQVLSDIPPKNASIAYL